MNPSKIRVICNPAAKGIEIDDSLRVNPAGLWKGHTGFKSLYVGMLKTQKDHETLLRALALLPAALGARLVILGEWPLRADFTRLAEEIDVTDRVAMPGFLLDPYPWFFSADFFVFSSRREGFGNVIEFFIGVDSIIICRESIAIGRDCKIAEYVVIRDQDHRTDSRPIRLSGFHASPVRISSDVWIGCKASILRGASVGDRSVIGAHALVKSPIPNDSLAVGMPARVVRRWKSRQ